MKAEIKTIQTLVKKDKNGKEYTIVYTLVKINNVLFVRKFYIWS